MTSTIDRDTTINLNSVEARAAVLGGRVTPPTHQASSSKAMPIWVVARLGLGWIFLWPFLDKLFGLGFAVESESAWINGGSPTRGFLEFGTKGPFADFFQSFAGATWADWLFMCSLLAIGAALITGAAVRIAAVGGAVLLVLMWLAALQPEHNPLIDDHVIYAVVLIGLAFINVGHTFGIGEWWERTELVQRFPILK